MGVFAQNALRVRELDGLDQLNGPFAGLLPAQLVVAPHRLGDLLPHRENRVQGRHRVLKDHCDLSPPDVGHLLLRFVQDLDAVQGQLVGADYSRRDG